MRRLFRIFCHRGCTAHIFVGKYSRNFCHATVSASSRKHNLMEIFSDLRIVRRRGNDLLLHIGKQDGGANILAPVFFVNGRKPPQLNRIRGIFIVIPLSDRIVSLRRKSCSAALRRSQQDTYISVVIPVMGQTLPVGKELFPETRLGRRLLPELCQRQLYIVFRRTAHIPLLAWHIFRFAHGRLLTAARFNTLSAGKAKLRLRW